jgi:hypothetical protein
LSDSYSRLKLEIIPIQDAPIAVTRCAELNLYGMVDAQIAVVEDELLASNTLTP